MMKENKITSRSNAEIKAAAKLKQKKYRDREGLFLLDGIKLFEEACGEGLSFRRVYLTEERLGALSADMREALGALSEEDRVRLVSKEVLEALTEQKSPEGIVSIVRRDSLKREVKDNGRNVLSYAILEDVQDPGNLGTIIRTADAAGFDAVVLTKKCADPFSEKALRSSMGSAFHLPVLQTEDLPAFLSKLRGEGFEIVGSALDGTDFSFTEKDRSRSVALILGNEAHGMSGAVKEACTRLVKIPIYGEAESLNVAVASGILLYAFTRK